MNDVTLFYREYGAGFPLVLLHGNGDSSEYFKNQIEYFSAEYRVITVDTRGHGKSPRGTAPFSLNQFAEDLKMFLDNLGIEKCHLLGFSDGANIALLFALKYPDYIDKLILNGADLSPSGVKRSVQIPIIIGYGMVSIISLFDKKAVPKKEMLGLSHKRVEHHRPKTIFPAHSCAFILSIRQYYRVKNHPIVRKTLLSGASQF